LPGALGAGSKAPPSRPALPRPAQTEEVRRQAALIRKPSRFRAHFGDVSSRSAVLRFKQDARHHHPAPRRRRRRYATSNRPEALHHPDRRQLSPATCARAPGAPSPAAAGRPGRRERQMAGAGLARGAAPLTPGRSQRRRSAPA